MNHYLLMKVDSGFEGSVDDVDAWYESAAGGRVSWLCSLPPPPVIIESLSLLSKPSSEHPRLELEHVHLNDGRPKLARSTTNSPRRISIMLIVCSRSASDVRPRSGPSYDAPLEMARIAACSRMVFPFDDSTSSDRVVTAKRTKRQSREGPYQQRNV